MCALRTDEGLEKPACENPDERPQKRPQKHERGFFVVTLLSVELLVIRTFVVYERTKVDYVSVNKLRTNNGRYEGTFVTRTKVEGGYLRTKVFLNTRKACV